MMEEEVDAIALDIGTSRESGGLVAGEGALRSVRRRNEDL
jgi:hypothetical protein